nr:hypothetical protein BgiMline_016785 [Biomphalaria glabrata]
MLQYTTMSSKDELIIQDSTMSSKDELIIQASTMSSKDELIIQDSTMSSKDELIIQDSTMSSKDDLIIHDSTMSSKDDLIIHDSTMSSKDDLIIHDSTMSSKDELIIQDSTMSSKDDLIIHDSTMSSKDELIIQDSTMSSKDELIIHDSTMSSKDELIIQDSTMSSNDDLIVQDTMSSTDDRIIPDKTMFSKDDPIIQVTTMSTSEDNIVKDTVNVTTVDLLVPNTTLATLDDPWTQGTSHMSVDPVVHDQAMLKSSEPWNPEKTTPSYTDTLMSTSYTPVNPNTEMSKSDDPLKQETTTTARKDVIRQETTTTARQDVIKQETTATARQDVIKQETTATARQDVIKQETTTTARQDVIKQETIATARQDVIKQETTATARQDVIKQETTTTAGQDVIKQETTATARQDVIKQETTTTAGQDVIKKESTINMFHDKHRTTPGTTASTLIKTRNPKRSRLPTIDELDDKTRLPKSQDENQEIRESNTTPETLERGNIDSCKDRCGEDISIPCSCSAKCGVYRNCCEDIKDNCFHTFQLGELEFSYLFDLETECTSDDYLVISGCSRNAQVNDSLFSILDNDTSNNVRPQKGIINDILNQIHVTDRSTGLTFKNIHVFNCNKLGNSFPLKWSAYFNDLDLFVNGHAVKERKDDLFTYSFSPPSNMPFVAPRCIHNSVGKCDSGLAGSSKHETLCPTITSYVTTEGVLKTYFNNKYCAECNGYHNVVPVSTWTVKDKHNFYFSIIGSFRDDNIIFSALPGSMSLWSKLQCSVRENNSLTTFPDHYLCDIVACRAGFHKRPDGECKQLHVLRFGLTVGTLTFIEKQYLSRSLRCLLSAYTEFEAVGEWQSFQTYYDLRLQKVLLFVEIAVYISDKTISRLMEQSLIIHYKTILTIVEKIKKVFFQWPYKSIAIVDHLSQIISVDIKLTNLDEPHKLELNNTVNQSKMIACVCISLFSEVKMTQDAPCIPECVHFQEYDVVDYNEDGSGNWQSTSDNCFPLAKSRVVENRVSILCFLLCSLINSFLYVPIYCWHIGLI